MQVTFNSSIVLQTCRIYVPPKLGKQSYLLQVVVSVTWDLWRCGAPQITIRRNHNLATVPWPIKSAQVHRGKNQTKMAPVANKQNPQIFHPWLNSTKEASCTLNFSKWSAFWPCQLTFRVVYGSLRVYSAVACSKQIKVEVEAWMLNCKSFRQNSGLNCCSEQFLVLSFRFSFFLGVQVPCPLCNSRNMWSSLKAARDADWLLVL